MMMNQSTRPRLALLHYTAPPIVGGVEAVLAEHARLFVAAGYPTCVIVGRGGADGVFDGETVKRIPEIDSEYPANLAIASALERGEIPPMFNALRDRIGTLLSHALADVDIVIAHNVLTQHFNLPLLAALHHKLEQEGGPKFIAWCHDLSRHVNPLSGATQYSGYPWDLLRAWRPEMTYVAVSTHRQRLLANILGCPASAIRVVPNGTDPRVLLGLSHLTQQMVDAYQLFEADLIMLMPIRITRAKNIEFALHVTAALKRSGLRPRLVVTGPPDPHAKEIGVYFDQLCGLRTELGIDEEAIFVYEGITGWPQPLFLDFSIVAELYRVADLVLMPSHREGFGMPVLECGMVGRPVFAATTVPVVDELGEGLVSRIQPEETPAIVAERILAWVRRNTTHRLRCYTRQVYTWPAIFTRSIEPLIAGLETPTPGRVE